MSLEFMFVLWVFLKGTNHNERLHFGESLPCQDVTLNSGDIIAVFVN